MQKESPRPQLLNRNRKKFFYDIRLLFTVILIGLRHL